jgi:methyl-accepting chemotaxis protein
MRRLADGDLSATGSDTSRREEVGAMGKAVSVFRDNAIENQRLRNAHASDQEQAEAARRASMRDLAQAFLAEVDGIGRAFRGTVARIRLSRATPVWCCAL